MAYGMGGGGLGGGGFGRGMRGEGQGREERMERELRGKATLKDVKLSRVLGLFRPYKKTISWILLLALAAAVIGIGPPLVMREIIDKAIPGHDVKLLLELAGLMVALPVTGGLLGVWQNHSNNKVGQGVMADLRRSLFQNLQRQSMAFFTHTRSGEVIQRLMGDVQAIQSIVTGTIVSTISQFVVIATTVVILFQMEWKLALISIIIVPIFMLPVRRVSESRKKLRIESQRVRAEMTSHLGEIFGVSGALLTRIFGREKLQERKYEEQNTKVMALELRVNLVGRWFGMMIGVLGPLANAIIYLYGGYNVINGKMTIGDLVAFSAYLNRLYGPISQLLNLHVELMTALGVFQRIYDYLDMRSDIIDEPNAEVLPPVQGRIAYRDVSFEYTPGNYALRNIGFEIEPGMMLALVGPSGAGKSTMIGMLARLYDPTEGHIEVDGRNIKKVTLESLRSSIAFVTQEPFLFHATIGENLRFARPDATLGELEEACRKAYIHDLIASLPEGYDTMVGERGHRLSGGERQRLAIARAILKNPRILVLDEATSHLDSESEAYVQAALEELMKGRTTMVIAHRLSTVLAADRIIALENGRMAEMGTHTELLQRGGLYARLYHTQFSKVEAGAGKAEEA